MKLETRKMKLESRKTKLESRKTKLGETRGCDHLSFYTYQSLIVASPIFVCTILVGLTEDMNSFFEVLQTFLPHLFPNISHIYHKQGNTIYTIRGCLVLMFCFVLFFFFFFSNSQLFHTSSFFHT